MHRFSSSPKYEKKRASCSDWTSSMSHARPLVLLLFQRQVCWNSVFDHRRKSRRESLSFSRTSPCALEVSLGFLLVSDASSSGCTARESGATLTRTRCVTSSCSRSSSCLRLGGRVDNLLNSSLLSFPSSIVGHVDDLFDSSLLNTLR